MFRAFLLFFFLFFFSPAFAEDPFIGYAAGGYDGKLLVFGVPSLNLYKENAAGIDLRGPVLSGTNKGGSSGSPDGRLAFAVDKAANSLLVFDLAATKVAKTIALPERFGPNALDTADGKTLCVAGELSGQVAKVEVDSGKVEVVKLSPKPRSPAYAAVTKDGKFCLVSDYSAGAVAVFSMSPFKLEKEIPVGLGPHGIAITPDNKTALVSNKFSASLSFIDLSGLKVEKTLKTSAVPTHVVVDSKGKFAYQSAFLGNVVKKIDLAKREVVDTFVVNSRPGGLAISPDDKFLLVINKYSTGLYESHKVSLLPSGGDVLPNNFQIIDIDPASGRYAQTVAQSPVLGEPFGAMMVPAASVKDPAIKGGKEFVAKAPRKPDLPEKKDVKISYGPAKPHKPGVFDMSGGSEVYLNAFSHQWAPNEIYVFKGDTIRFIIQNIDEKGDLIDNPDVVHGFTINGPYGERTNVLLPRGVAATVELKADKTGEYDFYCSHWCGSVHMEMRGKFIVE